jgi:hypothetical protein
MDRRIKAFIKGADAPAGTILAPGKSDGPVWEERMYDGIRIVFERRYNEIRSVQFESLADAMRWPGFEAVSID